MHARAIDDLAQFNDEDLFKTAARGLRVLLSNTLHLARQGLASARSGHNQAASILSGLAEEEAAKFHILLDAIRCDRRSNSKAFALHLDKFYNHLARGIYAQCYEMSFANFAEVERFVAESRQAHYLDGPEGFEWIFRNRILERREQQIYADFVHTEEGRCWTQPMRLYASRSFISDVTQTASSIAGVGVCAPQALETVAEMWRSFQVSDTTTAAELIEQNRATLDAMQERKLLRWRSDDDVHRVIYRWTFPMYSLDLSLDRSVSLDDLRKIREREEAAWYRREFGSDAYDF